MSAIFRDHASIIVNINFIWMLISANIIDGSSLVNLGFCLIQVGYISIKNRSRFSTNVVLKDLEL